MPKFDISIQTTFRAKNDKEAFEKFLKWFDNQRADLAKYGHDCLYPDVIVSNSETGEGT